MIQLRQSRGPVAGSRATYGRVTKKDKQPAIDISCEKRGPENCGEGVARVGVFAKRSEGVRLDRDQVLQKADPSNINTFWRGRISSIDPRN
jgi:hypothetical protein